ncbi:mannosyltransferase putative-domain-containing protein [Chaetomium tenue]|uniref:Mannosyltransferase putative-domain-containing protein n=1 Tax=Chaetomium tenue TaxID=1854479 RepID=A0ACB7P8I6_9PEZI|nr:mannosyltransferase putative-domain-containing protein [Chaetomium globosum]
MAIPRRILMAAAGLVCFIGFFTFYLHTRDTFSNTRSGYLAPNRTPTNSQKTGKLDPEAHKLPWADSFHAHFKALTDVKNITMAEAKAGCHWPADEDVNFQYNADVEWVVTDRSDEEISSRRKAWQELQSKIPLEIHYWDNEMTEATLKDLAAIYQPMSFNDLSQPDNILRVKKDGFYLNFQLKTAALINSKFAEPLLLDSDNIPILDPATLYESRVYQEYRTVFWPDIARSWPQNPAWAITNTPCRMDEYEQESGQMMVDKRHYWYHLQLAAWLNNEQGRYYNEFLLGDKDMFRFAWHALKTDYGRPKKWLTSVGTLNDGSYYCGHSFAQHHPDDGRVAFLHGGLVKSTALEVMQWNREEMGGYFRNYKRAPTDEDPAKIVHVEIKFDEAKYMPDQTEPFRVAMCTDMRDLEAGNLDDILPGWEKEYEELGGYWMLEQETKSVAEKAGAHAH